MQILVGILIPHLGALLDTLVPIIFLILYGIFQLAAGRAEANKKAPRPRKPRPPLLVRPQGQAADPAAAPVDQADALRTEVEEFLRRAQGKPPKPPVARKPKPTPPPAKPRRLVQTEKFKPNLRHEGVGEHVARHISSSKITAHAEQLGDKLESVHDRVEMQLHEKFDRQVGSLTRQVKKSDTTVQKPNVAAEVAKLLSNPEGMRQLIVAQEILRRPERW